MLALLEEICRSNEDSWERTFRIVRPDGAVRGSRAGDAPNATPTGQVTRLTGLDLDFSQHRRTEEALQARRDEEHDRTLRTLLETATQGIVSVDAHGTIVTANRAFEAMFGWAADELIGQPIELLMPSRLSATARTAAGGLRSRRQRARTDRRFRSKSA